MRVTVKGSVQFLLFIVCLNTALGDETRWLGVGNIHGWYSSAGREREVEGSSAIKKLVILR